MKLNNRAVDTAKPRDRKWKLSDGDGLHLLVHPLRGWACDNWARGYPWPKVTVYPTVR